MHQVQSLNGESKLLNSNKYVKCLAHAHERLYCGCHDSSVQVSSCQNNVMLSQLQYVIISQHSCDNIILIYQEIHLATGTVSTIQSGFKRLLAKANPIHALQIHGELIYAAGSSLDGSVIKVKNLI